MQAARPLSRNPPPVDEVAAVLLADPAPRALYKQSDLALDWFPECTSVGPAGDVDWFVLPGLEPDDAPLVGGGDLVVPFDASDAMPATVGTVPLWSAITRWVAGSLPHDQLAADLDSRRRALVSK